MKKVTRATNTLGVSQGSDVDHVIAHTTYGKDLVQAYEKLMEDEGYIDGEERIEVLSCRRTGTGMKVDWCPDLVSAWEFTIYLHGE